MPLWIALTGYYALYAFHWLWTIGGYGAPHLHAIYLQAVQLATLTLRIITP